MFCNEIFSTVIAIYNIQTYLKLCVHNSVKIIFLVNSINAMQQSNFVSQGTGRCTSLGSHCCHKYVDTEAKWMQFVKAVSQELKRIHYRGLNYILCIVQEKLRER